MALNAKVNPDCNYASNPYHECTETCLKRISEGKGRKDKKKSDNGHVYNKKYEDKKGNRACHRASNPYHECNEHCFKDAVGYKTPGPANEIKSGGIKMNESRSMPPREQETPKPYNSSVSMPPARFPIESQSQPEEIQVEDKDPSFSGKQFARHSHSPDYSRDSPKEAVKTHSSKNNNVVSEGREGATGSGSGSMSFSFSGVAHSAEGSDDDDDETQSVMSDSSVSVGKYRVKGRLSPILQSIFDKYGDIGASCQLESIAMRSYYLQCVCFVVQELQITQIKHLTKSKVKEMLSILNDVEASGINVSWLRQVLRENGEAIELIGQHQAIEEAIATCDKDIESARKKLESQMEALAVKEKEIEGAKKQIAETRAHVRELELKSSVLIETLNSVKSKVENGKSLLDGVL